MRRVILLPPLRERVPTASPTNAASSPASPNSAASFSGFPELSNQCGESSPDRQAMRRASPASPIDRHCTNAERRLLLRRQAVRRVVLRPPLRERVPTASPTSTASFPNCPNQCGESSRIVPTSAASPPRPPRRERASLAFPNCPTNAASRPPTAKQCGELLRLSRTVQTNAASRPPTAKQCGELLRLSRTVQTYAASYSPRIATSSAASPLMHPRTVGENLLFPRILRRTVLRTKTAHSTHHR